MPDFIRTITILIAGSSHLHANYENALTRAGFSCLYPSCAFCDLSTLTYDLLLLPGGGDFPVCLYNRDHPAPLHDSGNADDFAADLLQFQLLQSAVTRGKPILGICKGMQLINVFFGGDLHPHLPTADQHRRSGSDLFHPVFFPPYASPSRIFGKGTAVCDALLDLLASYSEVNSAHHQGVRQLGRELITLQYSEDYLPETIAHRTFPILGLQWHPERLPGFTPESMQKMIHLLLNSARL